jgi:excisionase family DNA binding protein
MHDRLLYRVEEVARMLAISRSKTYELIASGALPVIHVGRCVRVPSDALQRWLDAQGGAETTGAEDFPAAARNGRR